MDCIACIIGLTDGDPFAMYECTLRGWLDYLHAAGRRQSFPIATTHYLLFNRRSAITSLLSSQCGLNEVLRIF